MDSVPVSAVPSTYPRELAATPIRFRDRVLHLFRAPANLEYLRGVFASRVPAGRLRTFALETLADAVVTYAAGEGRAIELLGSDPVAMRGASRPAVSLWSEVRRLNRAFVDDRLALLTEQAALIDPVAPRDGVSEDTEPYHMRMFISDSLRPPGLEHLNTPGPLYALREDQSTWERRESFAPRPPASPGQPLRGRPGGLGGPSVAGDEFLYDPADAPWSRGDPNRTAEQALAEYWGDGRVTSDTMTGATETMGRTYGELYAWGDSWRENGGTRAQRYERIPFWQRGGRMGYDTDIEETLGTAGRELDAHVRGWDMDRVTKPRGQEYRRYGARSDHV